MVTHRIELMHDVDANRKNRRKGFVHTMSRPRRASRPSKRAEEALEHQQQHKQAKSAVKARDKDPEGALLLCKYTNGCDGELERVRIARGELAFKCTACKKWKSISQLAAEGPQPPSATPAADPQSSTSGRTTTKALIVDPTTEALSKALGPGVRIVGEVGKMAPEPKKPKKFVAETKFTGSELSERCKLQPNCPGRMIERCEDGVIRFHCTAGCRQRDWTELDEEGDVGDDIDGGEGVDDTDETADDPVVSSTSSLGQCHLKEDCEGLIFRAKVNDIPSIQCDVCHRYRRIKPPLASQQQQQTKKPKNNMKFLYRINSNGKRERVSSSSATAAVHHQQDHQLMSSTPYPKVGSSQRDTDDDDDEDEDWLDPDHDSDDDDSDEAEDNEEEEEPGGNGNRRKGKLKIRPSQYSLQSRHVIHPFRDKTKNPDLIDPTETLACSSAETDDLGAGPYQAEPGPSSTMSSSPLASELFECGECGEMLPSNAKLQEHRKWHVLQAARQREEDEFWMKQGSKCTLKEGCLGLFARGTQRGVQCLRCSVCAKHLMMPNPYNRPKNLMKLMYRLKPSGQVITRTGNVSRRPTRQDVIGPPGAAARVSVGGNQIQSDPNVKVSEMVCEDSDDIDEEEPENMNTIDTGQPTTTTSTATAAVEHQIGDGGVGHQFVVVVVEDEQQQNVGSGPSETNNDGGRTSQEAAGVAAAANRRHEIVIQQQQQQQQHAAGDSIDPNQTLESNPNQQNVPKQKRRYPTQSIIPPNDYVETQLRSANPGLGGQLATPNFTEISKHVRVKCEFCGWLSTTWNELQRHYKENHRNRFPSLKNLMFHANCQFSSEGASARVYVCLRCVRREFDDEGELENHIVEEHEGVPEVMSCSKCHSEFYSETELDAHCRAIHPDRFPCPHCRATLGSQRNLQRHIAESCKGMNRIDYVPVGQDGYDYANSALVSQQNSTMKSSRNSPVKIMNRGAVGGGFRPLGTGSHHMKYHHHQQQQSNSVDRSPSSSSSSVLISLHQHASTSSSTSASTGAGMECHLCGETFISEHLLNRHMILHNQTTRRPGDEACGESGEGREEFKCPVCGVNQVSGAQLNKHLMWHDQADQLNKEINENREFIVEECVPIEEWNAAQQSTTSAADQHHQETPSSCSRGDQGEDGDGDRERMVDGDQGPPQLTPEHQPSITTTSEHQEGEQQQESHQYHAQQQQRHQQQQAVVHIVTHADGSREEITVVQHHSNHHHVVDPPQFQPIPADHQLSTLAGGTRDGSDGGAPGGLTDKQLLPDGTVYVEIEDESNGDGNVVEGGEKLIVSPREELVAVDSITSATGHHQDAENDGGEFVSASDDFVAVVGRHDSDEGNPSAPQSAPSSNVRSRSRLLPQSQQQQQNMENDYMAMYNQLNNSRGRNITDERRAIMDAEKLKVTIDLPGRNTKHKGFFERIKCEFCPMLVDMWSNLRRHYTAEHRKEFAKDRLLQQRVLNYVAMDSSKVYICFKCTKEIPSQALFFDHITKIHQGLLTFYPCDKCDEMFDTAAALATHKRMNHTVKYVCSGCNNAFSSSRNVRRHMQEGACQAIQRYDEEIRASDVFACNLCLDQHFLTYEQLRAHTNAAHGMDIIIAEEDNNPPDHVHVGDHPDGSIIVDESDLIHQQVHQQQQQQRQNDPHQLVHQVHHQHHQHQQQVVVGGEGMILHQQQQVQQQEIHLQHPAEVVETGQGQLIVQVVQDEQGRQHQQLIHHHQSGLHQLIHHEQQQRPSPQQQQHEQGPSPHQQQEPSPQQQHEQGPSPQQHEQGPSPQQQEPE